MKSVAGIKIFINLSDLLQSFACLQNIIFINGAYEVIT